MRRDILSAYAASGAKVLSWVIVSAIVFRADPLAFAVLALIRGTVALLNYTSLGLGPTLVRFLAQAPPASVQAVASHEQPPGNVLSYASAKPADPPDERARLLYAAGAVVALLMGVAGSVLALTYATWIRQLHEIPFNVPDVQSVAFFMGIGVVLRVISEAPAAVIQTTGGITRDNTFSILAEAVWVIAFLIYGYQWPAMSKVAAAAEMFTLSSALLLLCRFFEAHGRIGFRWRDFSRVRGAVLLNLIVAGALVGIAQAADFLFAPTDYILINRLISPAAVAHYAPCVQIDSGLLLIVSALSAVLIPKAALAHAAGNTRVLHQYYLRGTFTSAALLIGAGVFVYFLSPWIFELWLGDPLPITQTILSLVLIHTVVGGSSGVGRSILLGMGKVKPFAIAALASGVLNVVASFAFVKFGGLGLKGIVYGTIVAAVARAIVWQPWYVLRTLRRDAANQRLVATVGATSELPP
jgi:O-antigen/teichoic acid export membrane protein